MRREEEDDVIINKRGGRVIYLFINKLTITITKEQRRAKPFLNGFWLKIARYL